MPEAVSPQACSPLRGHNEARVVQRGADEPGVILTERRLVSLVQVAAWPDSAEQVTDTVASLLRCAPPQGPAGSSGDAKGAIPANRPRTGRDHVRTKVLHMTPVCRLMLAT